jgi:hypothetical protein
MLQHPGAGASGLRAPPLDVATTQISLSKEKHHAKLIRKTQATGRPSELMNTSSCHETKGARAQASHQKWGGLEESFLTGHDLYMSTAGIGVRGRDLPGAPSGEPSYILWHCGAYDRG